MTGWITPPTAEELKRMADPMSLTFRPSATGCVKCGETKNLAKDGTCRKPIPCFERAVKARVAALKERRKTEQGALV